MKNNLHFNQLIKLYKMIYTLILTAINLFANTQISINIFGNDIEQGLEDDIDFDIIIPDCYSKQEDLDLLV